MNQNPCVVLESKNSLWAKIQIKKLLRVCPPPLPPRIVSQSVRPLRCYDCGKGVGMKGELACVVNNRVEYV